VKRWWVRPAVRMGAALMLPVLVPAIITALIWALPGDPASLICPPKLCKGGAELAARWNLDGGPLQFFLGWMDKAIVLDFGRSWTAFQGMDVGTLLAESIPVTCALVALSSVWTFTGVFGGATGWISRHLDPLIQISGTVPVLVLTLVGAAVVDLTYGFGSTGKEGQIARLLIGSVVLGLADGAFAGAVTGTRGLFRRESNQRYVGVAILRGERTLANTLPNVMPALAGQVRGRLLHLLSGAVVVEVMLKIDGIGDLLWIGTLEQDFGLVLATATLFAVASGLLLFGQAACEILVALHVRRSPRVGAV
jgi:ABC-type dipeptide/oligopeptide/nickel transport system permease component